MALGAPAAFVALLVLAGSLLARRLEPVERAAAPSDPETRFLATRSGRVHVLDLGPTGGAAGGEPILLIHGTGRSIADWQEGLAGRLARSHRVVAFDEYGNGLSDRPPWGRNGIALWARQAVDVLDALGIPRATVVGHSAGGCVAAILAADHPERVARAVFLGHGTAMDPTQIVPILPGVGEVALARMRIFSTLFSAEHERRLAAAYEIRGTRASLLTYLRRQYTIDGIRLVTGTYEAIEAPVLQVHGTLDASIPIAAARRLTPRLRQVRFVAVEGIGHDVHVEAPETLAAAIEDFVVATRPRAPSAFPRP